MPRNPKNILDKKFGKLLVISFAGNQDFGARADGTGRKSLSTWNCICDCGRESVRVGSQLTAGKTKTCGNCTGTGEFASQDLTGQKFATWTVVDRTKICSNRWKVSRTWNCVCECGQQESFRASRLLAGDNLRCQACHSSKLPKPNGKLIAVQKVSSNTFLWKCECGGEIVAKRGVNNCGCTAFNQLKRDHKHAARKVYDQYIKDAERRGKSFELTENEFFNLITQPCHYTGLSPSKKIKTQVGDFFWNGVDRKDNSKGYTLDNCLPCSQHANWAKETRNYDDFIVWLKTVAKFWNDKEAAEFGF